MQWDALGSDRVFSAADARAAGLDASTLRTAVRQGSIRRLHRGWYTSARPADDKDLYLLRILAAVRARNGSCAASHVSALLVHGLPLVDHTLDTVWLDHESDRHRRREGTVRLSPAILPPVSVIRAHVTTPVLVVPAAIAIVQSGCLNGPRAAIAAADAALRLGRTSRADLTDASSRLARRMGIGPTNAALSIADGRRESPGESLLALVLHQQGIEAEPRFEIPDGGTTWRADFRVQGHRVLIEFDGKVKYADREQVWREKKREDRLRDLGWEIVRVTWADLSRPGVIGERIRRAITRSTRAAAS